MRNLIIALAVFFCVFAAPAQAEETPDVTHWTVVPEKSHIRFAGKQMAAPFKGEFRTFDADIHFDAEKLEHSHVRVEIDIASVDTQNQERDDKIKGSDWFDVTGFPKAVFESSAFEKTGDNAYRATGELTVRDVTAPAVLDFTLNIANDGDGPQKAVVEGTAELSRTAFDLGRGDWADTSIIADGVTVTVDLQATADAN